MSAQERKILMYGRTGVGKSTAASVIAGQHNLFFEDASSVSVTKNHQVATVQVENFSITIVDTLGLGDTSLSPNEVLFRLADACHLVRDGLHQVFFVYDGRFTVEEIEVYTLLRTVIFNNDIVRFTTLVRTNFPGFMDANVCAADIERTKAEKPIYAEIINCCNRVIHVNNLQMTDPEMMELAARRREQGRAKMLLHIHNCSEKYMPHELAQIDERIASHVEEAARLQREKVALEQSVQELKDNQTHMEQAHQLAITTQQQKMSEIERQIEAEKQKSRHESNMHNQVLREERAQREHALMLMQRKMDDELKSERSKSQQELQNFRNEIHKKNLEITEKNTAIQHAQTKTAVGVREEGRARMSGWLKIIQLAQVHKAAVERAKVARMQETKKLFGKFFG